MKVLVIGSGGREHALVWKIAKSPKVDKVYCAPGNGGIAEQAELVDVSSDSVVDCLEFATRESIDLTVVGPETPLVEGIVDLFEKAGLKIFGPRAELAQLEGSKVYAKTVLDAYSIPTASFKIFEESSAARSYIEKSQMPIVVKADGLCAGKGVVVCKTREEAQKAIAEMMDEKLFGAAGNRVVIEECLEGEEASIIAVVDGHDFVFLASSQDHKRAYDGDRGPNTGGMGAYSPAPAVTDELLKVVSDEVLKPLLKGLTREGKIYKGALYVGIMITKTGPKVLEFNARFGDPETQAILPRLKTDLVDVMERAIAGTLGGFTLEWDPRPCVAVVVASGGYPGYYAKGKEIYGFEALAGLRDVAVFHAGTKKGQRRTDNPNLYVTTGGRVLAVTALGPTVKEAIDACYNAVEKIKFNGIHYRKDIGYRALAR